MPPIATPHDEPSARQASYAAFVASHRSRAVSVAWRLCDGDAALADEVAQRAFVAAWDALPTFREEAALTTWFYRILVRTAGRQRRWQSIRTRVHRVLHLSSASSTLAPTADPPLRRRIQHALSELSDAQREVFVLVHLEGFTLTEVADITARAPGTVKSHLHRALQSLRASLDDLRETS